MMRSALLLSIKGFCMGMADLVPGVSGGTMALILGIYTRLINAIRSFDQAWLMALLRFDLGTVARRPHWSFLIPLLLGIFAALLFFTRVISLPRLLETHHAQIYGLFFGLILASIVVLLGETGRLRIVDGVILGIGTALGLVIVTAVPFETPETTWFVFVSGMIAICAMILPGISGSFILLLMHKYSYVISAVGRLDFNVLAPFALGCVTGLAVFSRFLSWLLAHYYRPTLLVIKGILLASLWVLWPYQLRETAMIAGHERVVHSQPVLPTVFDDTVLASGLLALTGFIVVLAINALARQRDRVG